MDQNNQMYRSQRKNITDLVAHCNFLTRIQLSTYAEMWACEAGQTALKWPPTEWKQRLTLSQIVQMIIIALVNLVSPSFLHNVCDSIKD